MQETLENSSSKKVCPKCKSPIEKDTPECPECHMIIIAEGDAFEERLRKIQDYSLSQLLLKEREYLFEMIYRSDRLKSKIIYCIVYSFLFAVIYGGVLGAYAGFYSSLFMALKVPLLLAGALSICLPLLYTCNIYIGSRLTFFQLLTTLLVATYLIGLVLLSLSPILLLFIVFSNSIPFIHLLNLAFFFISAWIGISLLWQSMDYFANKNRSEVGSLVVWTWSIIYAFVFIQCAWTLKIFMDLKDMPFFKQMNVEGDFYTAIFDLIQRMMGGGN